MPGDYMAKTNLLQINQGSVLKYLDFWNGY
jgi:hypothetical protein